MEAPTRSLGMRGGFGRLEENLRTAWENLTSNKSPDGRRRNTMRHIMSSVLECEPLKGERDSPEKLLQSREVSVSSGSSSSDMGPPRRVRWTRSSVLAAILLFCSVSICSIMWLTSLFDNSVLKLVSIRNDLDMIYSLWRSPPTRPYLHVYLFNYTNYEKVLAGEKPHVQQVGPFVFQERMERVFVKFHDNGTVSFQENRTIDYRPELSNGSINQLIRVPNVPLLTATAKLRKMDYLVQKLASKLMSSYFEVEPFPKVKVRDVVWGYDDGFYRAMRKMKAMWDGEDPPRFGLLASRKGVHHEVMTMKTGSEDINQVGEVTHWDGQERLGAWGDTKCDEVGGSDGSLFPGNRAHAKEPMYVFAHGMCRKMPILFNMSTSSADGFPVQQYQVDPNIFNYKANMNQCFKNEDTSPYPPNGVFFSGPCVEGAPMFASFPHFLNGDPKLREDVLGLEPDPSKHTSYFQLHDRLGVCLLAKTRFQLNIRLQKAKFMHQFQDMRDDVILPVGWIEYDSGPLPDYFVDIVFHLTYTVRIVQAILKYASLVIALISGYLLYRTLAPDF